jgi:hypothetical protein
MPTGLLNPNQMTDYGALSNYEKQMLRMGMPMPQQQMAPTQMAPQMANYNPTMTNIPPNAGGLNANNSPPQYNGTGIEALLRQILGNSGYDNAFNPQEVYNREMMKMPPQEDMIRNYYNSLPRQ